VLIEALRPLLVRFPDRDLQLEPGQPVDLPDRHVQRLLERAVGKVRVVLSHEPIVIEPTHPNPRPIYSESITGELLGPAEPEFLAQVGEGEQATFWVIATFAGIPRWIRSDRLQA